MLFPEGSELVTEFRVIDKSLLWDNIDFSIRNPGMENVSDTTLITIYINDWGGIRAVKSVYENYLKFAESLLEFQLIEESMITVAGVIAYQFSYYYDKFVNITHPPAI